MNYIDYKQTEDLLKLYPAMVEQTKQLALSMEQLCMKETDERIYSLVIGNRILNNMPFPPVGNISDKTAKVAITYKDMFEKVDNKAITDTMRDMILIENTVKKIDLACEDLPVLWKKVIGGKYLTSKQRTWAEIEKDCRRSIDKRTLQTYKKNAIKKIQRNIRMTVNVYEEVLKTLESGKDN